MSHDHNTLGYFITPLWSKCRQGILYSRVSTRKWMRDHETNFSDSKMRKVFLHWRVYELYTEEETPSFLKDKTTYPKKFLLPCLLTVPLPTRVSIKMIRNYVLLIFLKTGSLLKFENKVVHTILHVHENSREGELFYRSLIHVFNSVFCDILVDKRLVKVNRSTLYLSNSN